MLRLFRNGLSLIVCFFSFAFDTPLLSPSGRLRLFRNGLSLIVCIFSFAFDTPLLSPSGRVARSAERGQIKILPYIEASPWGEAVNEVD